MSAGQGLAEGSSLTGVLRKEGSKIQRIPGKLPKIPTSLHLSGFIFQCRKGLQSFTKSALHLEQLI